MNQARPWPSLRGCGLAPGTYNVSAPVAARPLRRPTAPRVSNEAIETLAKRRAAPALCGLSIGDLLLSAPPSGGRAATRRPRWGRSSQLNFPALAPPANPMGERQAPPRPAPGSPRRVSSRLLLLSAANRSPFASPPAARPSGSRGCLSGTYYVLAASLGRSIIIFRWANFLGPSRRRGKPANSSARRPFAPRPTPGRVPRPPRYRAAR